MSSNARGIHESPNIYTREVDVSSYTSKSLGITTLGLVGETLIGPAFQPIQISTYKEFQTYFGGVSPEKYPNGFPKYELGYVAKDYLKQSQQLYVTRVLGLSGYKYKNLWSLNLKTPSGVTSMAIIRSKAEYTGENLVPYVTGVTDITITPSTLTSLDTEITISINAIDYKVSLNPASKNYILKVLGTNPKSSSSSEVFVEEMYEEAVNICKSGNTVNFVTGTTISIETSDLYNDYSSTYMSAKTPWFVSEIKGTKVIPLFRFYTLSDGENANNMFKVSVKNIDPATLKFDIIVRAIYDTDQKPIILEQFNNCTLDPNDGNNYLGAQVGTVDEVFKLNSKYIIVEIAEDDKVKDSVPMGFEGYDVRTFISASTETPVGYNNSYEDTGSSSAKKPYFGVTNTTDSDLFKYKGISTGLTLSSGFHLESSTIDYSRCAFIGLAGTTYNDYVKSDKKLMKFTVSFSGGFDGWDMFRYSRTNTDDYQFNRYKNGTGVIGSTPTSNFKSFLDKELGNNYNIPDVPVATGITSDFYAFWSAARSFADPEFVDINVFATPGIDWKNQAILSSEILDMIENERKDSIYIMASADKAPMTASGLTVTDSKSDMISPVDIVSQLEDSGIDSNYAATYYPWCQYLDAENGVYIYMPTTRDVVRNIAYTDNTAYAWFVPAGIGRGNVDCVKAKKSLVLDEEDTLYAGRINIIKTFALDGVKIWGQKTLQIADTALNRIGPRRMMLYIRKAVRRGNLPLIFEPNDNTTKNKFLEIVNPILNNVKTNRGLSDYKIVIDDSAEAKDRHEMNVKIWVKPIGSLEYISIDFMITDQGFDFSTI